MRFSALKNTLKMKHLRYLFFLTLLTLKTLAQDTSKLQFNGYITEMPSMQYIANEYKWDNLLHNRLNFQYAPNDNFTSVLELRNRFIVGENVRNEISRSNYSNDNGFVDLSFNFIDQKGAVFNTAIDRAYISNEQGKLRTTVGRQRINWGQTFVWNPNDIFNAYSFFDFDYSERPGSDALRFQYFNTETSVTETAIKIDKDNKLTTALFHRFNTRGYDIQVLGGILNSKDIVSGLGWSGAINYIAFRGEISYFRKIKSDVLNISPRNLLLVDLGADYTFPNGLYLQTEFLYKSYENLNAGSFSQYLSAPLNVKDLSIVKYNCFAQLSHSITPLINTSFSIMYMPGINGTYIGPNFDFSISDNSSLSFILQWFSLSLPQSSRQNIIISFLKFKINF